MVIYPAGRLGRHSEPEMQSDRVKAALLGQQPGQTELDRRAAGRFWGILDFCSLIKTCTYWPDDPAMDIPEIMTRNYQIVVQCSMALCQYGSMGCWGGMFRQIASKIWSGLGPHLHNFFHTHFYRRTCTANASHSSLNVGHAIGLSSFMTRSLETEIFFWLLKLAKWASLNSGGRQTHTSLCIPVDCRTQAAWSKIYGKVSHLVFNLEI